MAFADRVDLAHFEEAQQFRLHVHREFADFVEKERPAICGPHDALMIFRGSGERALAVPKELALEQILWNGGAVEGEKGHAGALRIHE